MIDKRKMVSDLMEKRRKAKENELSQQKAEDLDLDDQDLEDRAYALNDTYPRLHNEESDKMASEQDIYDMMEYKLEEGNEDQEEARREAKRIRLDRVMGSK